MIGLFEEGIRFLNNLLWSKILIFVLIGVGIWFTIGLKGFQFTSIKEMFRLIFERTENKNEGISSFQAFTMSLASRVGTGNMAGVAIAIASGGPGAVFWMWIIALIGSSSAFVESTLAQVYKERDGKTYRGGPAYYMEKALHNRRLGIIFSILITLCFGFIFNAVQSNTITAAFTKVINGNDQPYIISMVGRNFDILQLITGAILVAVTSLVIFGGVKRIAKFTEKVVPIMALAYLAVSLFVIILHIDKVPEIFTLIIKEAFGLQSIVGAGLGAVLMQGIKRGLFSNEAGMGSAPNAAATAEVSHPAKQGLIQSLGVFTDTLIICTATAFIILIGGNYIGAEEGIQLTQSSLVSQVGNWGSHFIAVCIFLFAFSSIIGNYYYGESNIQFISKNKYILTSYRVLVLAMVLFGALAKVQIVWDLADIFMGLMALLNIYAIARLFPIAKKVYLDYQSQKAEGKNPIFKASNVGLEGKTDCWK